MKWMYRDNYQFEEDFREISYAKLQEIVTECEHESQFFDWGYLAVEIEKIDGDCIYVIKAYEGE